ncbi:tyrosine-type recombinase/integrase [Arthrobacter sp.]|uniref:tyrosine-type recombinase/integrase n=1 Tax=Arthrobacter sp. TaxID=1667 RepID=UPI003A90126C
MDAIEAYLAFLSAVDRSPNTVKAYAHDLKDYFTFLSCRGLDWQRVCLEDIGRFVEWLRLPPAGRTGEVVVLPLGSALVGPATINRKLAAVGSFYQHQARHGVELGDLLVTWAAPGRRTGWRPFLHHISKGRPQRRRAITLKVPSRLPRVLAIEEVQPMSSSTYRGALYRWLERCQVHDEHGDPAHLTPHQWRHTLGTRLINKDVPQEVVRRILDHDSPQMTAHYARLHDTTIRRHWEKARKIDVSGATVVLDPESVLAEAAWAKQRLGRATQALPNGFCGLPVQKTCPHANACLTCPMFITTAEFLPQHREHRVQALEIISAAEARGQTRLVEMTRQVAENLETIIVTLEDESTEPEATTDGG